MKTPHRAPLVLAAAFTLVLAACGEDAPPGEPGAMPPSEPATMPPEPAVPDQIEVGLEPVGDFVAEGVVTLTPRDGSYVLDADVDTHIGPGDYPMHIHSGSCAEGGPVAVPLSSVEGHEAGEGTAQSVIPAAELSQTGSYFIQLHHAQGGQPIACGDVPPLAP